MGAKQSAFSEFINQRVAALNTMRPQVATEVARIQADLTDALLRLSDIDAELAELQDGASKLSVSITAEAKANG